MSPGAAHEEDLLSNESRCCTWRGLVNQWVQALNIGAAHEEDLLTNESRH